MCGIAAIVGLHGARFESWRIEAMSDALRHRGPDDQGCYADAAVLFGFRRLSILDLTIEGHQPMYSHDDRYVIIYNGEIYNYIELRRDLETLGHRFRSTGDTEVLLAAFGEWGPQCLPKLNGMWAFLIHDRTSGRVFGSRDRFGVKPLYYHRRDDAVLFASEIKAFAATELYQPTINWRTSAVFLLEGRLDYSTETLYGGVEQIPAGSWFVLEPDGALKISSFWALPEEEPVARPDATERFAEIFEDAVRLRLRSDVPVGVCLSGGLDSSSIICAMARQREAAQPLFAFSYNSAEFDESAYLQATIAQTGATRVSLTLSGQDYWDRFERVLAMQDEPVHSMTAIVGYSLMELARAQGVPVVLNGQGADETAAGYHSYFLYYWHALLSSGRLGSLRQEIHRHSIGLGRPARDAWLSVMRYALLWRLGALSAYRRVTETRRRRQLLSHPWFTADLTDRMPVERQAHAGTLREGLIEAVIHDPLPLYLRVEDRNSMAHSVEARLPFLDYRLVSLLFSLPAAEKMRGPWNKFILRDAMRGRIPEIVRNRVEKFGFPTPVPQWIASGLDRSLHDLLASAQARERGIYRTDRVLADLERVRLGDGEFAGNLVRMAQFELWSQQLSAQPAARSL